jgi:hypothetical protein
MSNLFDPMYSILMHQAFGLNLAGDPFVLCALYLNQIDKHDK